MNTLADGPAPVTTTARARVGLAGVAALAGSLVALASTAGGCGAPRVNGRAGASASGAEGQTAQATLPPPLVAPARGPLPVAAATDRGRRPWPVKPLPAGTRLGGIRAAHPGLSGPDRVAVTTADGKGALLDARTGAVLVTLPAPPARVTPKAGAVLLEGQPLRLLRVADAKVIEPVVNAPIPPHHAWLDSTLHSRVAVLAETRGADGDKMVGLSSDDLTRFTLRRAPFPSFSRGFNLVLDAPELQVQASSTASEYGASNGTPFTLPHEAQCVRARVDERGPPACIEFLPTAAAGSEARWLDLGFFSWGTSVGHPSWGRPTLAIADGAKSDTCVRIGAHSIPPRIVVACERTREAFLWAPGRVWSFTATVDPRDMGGVTGADISAILPVPDVPRPPDASAPPTSRWIDLAGGRVVTTPPMVPLAIASFAGVEPTALASTRVGNARLVWAVDFDATTRDLVASIDDCAGDLVELPQRLHRFEYAVLACVTSKERTVRDLLWTEIVDTSRHVRWRTSLMPELFFDDGLVVVSTQKVVEAFSRAPRDLSSVDLAALP